MPSTITSVAGNGAAGYSGDGGPATAAALYFPTSVAVDSAGNLYIADTNNNCVRKVSASTGVISTVAGNGTFGYSGDGGPATAAELSFPSAVAVDGAGDLFIADTNNNRIREESAATGVITTIAGNGSGGYFGDGGPATSAALRGPYGVAVDSGGNLFIADSDNQRVRAVNAATGVISTVAGNGTVGHSGDGGPATAAALDDPKGVAVDAAGNLYIADFFNSRVRAVNASTGVISTVAGDGSNGYSGDGGPATAAALNFPAGVAVDGAGNLFIADFSNNRIREVIAAPARLAFAVPSSVVAGTPFTITVTAQDLAGDTVTDYAGTVHFAGSNGAMADYTFTAADQGSHTFTLTLTQAQTLTVTAVDTADSTVTGSATFTVTPAAADHIALQIAAALTAGVPFDLTVTVRDAYGNTVTDYTGTVQLQLMGPVMPMADYVFTAGDLGSHTFSNLVLDPTGMYTLLAADLDHPSMTGSASFAVT